MTSFNKIPNVLFYNPKPNIYKMIDVKKSACVGEMSVVKRKDLYIESLNIEPHFRRKGFGKKFLDFAVVLSKKMGLKGNLRTMAGLTKNDLANPSHIFYRKYGFTSDNKQILDQIDECIKNNKQPAPYDIPIVIMYYTKN